MKPKHTKGPTYVLISAVIHGSCEEPIEFKCRSEKQALALTSVLSAAPEMLEALETAIDALLSYDIINRFETVHPLIGALLSAEAAIKKARGES